jgi:predicted unusual protein kinase regulating ubiquinone biosynthesis (AarF/ABC1/UbiB family)
VIAEAIDRSRYRRLRRFLARLFAHLVWFDLVLNQPLLRRFRSEPRARWTALAREYRSLAVELGGVLIKLGQYLSTRVDVLPVEITRELSGLQDQVPAVPFPEIARRIEQDFGRPAAELFGRIDPEPAGAASLAQAHRATLPGGEAVVVKVLRPGIERLVETDLAAIGLAIRWLRPWRRIRRRVDLDRLFDEFARTTRAELDMEREAAHAERFAEDFRDDPGILVPAVHHALTARHTLTLEDVGYLRIGDLEAIAAAGVSLAEVARRLYRAYMEQLFVHHFVHCDPHPGNLFIRPLDEGAPEAGGEGGRPFQIAFVDFGMMSAIPEHLWEALAEVVIAAGTRDARRLVRAYRDAGILLPEADLARLEEIHRDLFQRFWGLKLSELQGVAQAQAPHLIWQYRDVVYQAPVQFPVDLLFTFRALGILTGMATTLDPEFDPWAATLPFAEELAKEGLGEAARRALGELTAAGAVLLRLPAGLERAVALAEGEGLRVRAELSDDARRSLRRIERTGGRVAWTVAAAALLLAGVELELARPGASAALGLWIAAGAAFLWGLVRR